MAGTQDQKLQDNFNIDTQIIRNLAYLLYSNMNLNQDRQLSGLRLSS